jgi:hypothetical protein
LHPRTHRESTLCAGGIAIADGPSVARNGPLILNITFCVLQRSFACDYRNCMVSVYGPHAFLKQA